MKKGRIMIILILGGLLIIGLGQNQQRYGPKDPKQQVTSIHGITYVEQQPIKILNDSAFTLYSSGGSGSPDDPYQITGYNITDTTSYLIHIENTTASFSINNCFLNGSGAAPLGVGIWLENVTHGTIESNIICNISSHGIYLVEFCNNNTLSDNTIHHCSAGISLWDFCYNNTLFANTIYNCDGEGIYLWESSNNIILNNIVHDCPDYTVYLYISHNNTLSANMIYNCGVEGIALGNSNNNTIVSNTLHDCYYAIYMDYSNNNTLSGNTIYNCASEGILLGYSSNNTILNNIIHNCTGASIGLDTSCNYNTFSGNTIYDCSSYGLLLWESNNNTLSDNTIHECDNTGIELLSSSNNTLSSNVIYNIENGEGIELALSENNTILSNTIYDCSGIGIVITENSYNNTISNNNVYKNSGYGLRIDSLSDDNTVNWNNFVDNNAGFPTRTSQAFDSDINNNISYNYWDDHTSPDDDDPPDGIVDTPYNIEGDSNQDPFPLTTPVLPTVTILMPLAQDYEDATFTIQLTGRLSIQYQYYIEGVDNVNQTWTTSVSRTLADGIYTLHAYGSDILGQTVHDSVTFRIDTMIPTIKLTSPTNNTVHPSGKTIDVAVTDAHLHTVLYNWDGTTNQTWSGEYETGLPTGEIQHILQVYANDSYNKWATKVFIFTTDDTAPTITLDSPTNDTRHPGGTAINLTVTDLHLETVLYNWDNATNQTLSVPYNVTLPSDAGQHVLKVYAKDQAGHWTVQTYVFTTRRSGDLGPLIGLSIIGISTAALAGGGYFLLKQKGLRIRDLLGRKPPEE